MPGMLNENDRLPERAATIARTEAEKAWFEQYWFKDMVEIALPVLALALAIAVLVSLYRRGVLAAIAGHLRAKWREAVLFTFLAAILFKIW